MKDFAEGASKKAAQRYKNSISMDNHEEFRLGANTSRIYFEDPKLLLFTLSRYKFVSKMLSGRKNVLEVGCQEGFGAVLVAKEVSKLTCIDFYVPHIESCKDRFQGCSYDISFSSRDILAGGSGNEEYDAAFSLDVLEHVDRDSEDLFMVNILAELSVNAVVILGMPSLESQRYASERSKVGHVNCKSGEELRNFGSRHLENIAIFSMNDEVLHTGFFPMSQYLFLMGSKK